jgi:HEAT repeat protein
VPDLVLLGKEPEMLDPAVDALAKIGPKAVPDLVNGLYQRQAQVRLTSAMALGRIGPPAKEAIPMLGKLLRDQSSEVRKAASEALLKIQQK